MSRVLVVAGAACSISVLLSLQGIALYRIMNGVFLGRAEC